jgi:3-deoxy-manno-octulosonate cytidylyltransferase (CMP-KDO synthetase)
VKTVIVIPARYQSSRFPGKPLALIHGVSMIERVYRLASKVPDAAVYVATDDGRIREAVERFGGRAIMTDPGCRNGTERVYAAAQTLTERPSIIINLQGDSPLTPPWILEALIGEMRRDSTIGLATPAVRVTREQYEALLNRPKDDATSGTLVVFDKNHRALYFSKAVIPYLREVPAPGEPLPVYKHIGIYAFRWHALTEYLQLPPSPLEAVESLEQLRALEHGIPIKVVEVDYRDRTPWSVDTPNDLQRVEAILQSEGEL